VYNNCKHQDAYDDTRAQGVSFTTGVPAMIGAMMVLTNKWTGAGVFNVEDFNPDPFMKTLPEFGLPWHEMHDIDLEL
jgi:saccharopine dehydrogenase (NAD+, L-lysine forming)